MVLIIYISGWKTVFHAPRHHRRTRWRGCSIPPFRIRDQDLISLRSVTTDRFRVFIQWPSVIRAVSPLPAIVRSFQIVFAGRFDRYYFSPSLVRSARLNLIRRLPLDGSRTSIYHPGKNLNRARDSRGGGRGRGARGKGHDFRPN